MASSVWTGYLTFGLISMPVRLFSGARGERVSFHMLHRKDHVRVKQQYICPEDGEVMDRGQDIVKGYEYRKGEYVIIEPEEIKKIEPRTAKAMEILEFVRREGDRSGLLRVVLLHDAGRGRSPALCIADESDAGFRVTSASPN